MAVSLPLTTKIAQAAGQEVEYRVREVQFGNGFIERVKDGINNEVQYWSIVWTNLSQAEVNTVRTALSNVNINGDYFTWQPEGESSTMKFLPAGRLARTVKSGEYSDLSLSLKQIFDL